MIHTFRSARSGAIIDYPVNEAASHTIPMPATFSLHTTDLLDRRLDGRLRGHEFCNRILYDPSHFVLSTKHQLVTASNGTLHCIDMSDRFILGGNTSIYIYDLFAGEERQQQHINTTTQHRHPHAVTGRHQVLQQSANASPNSAICALQWYRPDDTGIFVSGSYDGTAHVWDTANMAPVLTLQPYNNTNDSFGIRAPPQRPVSVERTKTLRCLRLNMHREALAAAASYDDPAIKLLDLRSGTSSHTLTPSTSTSGVSDLQWSASCEYILASCSRDSILRLWDIRRPNQVLTTLSDDSVAADVIPAVALPTIGKQLARKRPHGVRRGDGSNHHEEVTTTTTAGTHLLFAGNHWLVALDGHKGDIHVWDLRFPQPVRQPGRYVNPATNGKPLRRNVRRQPAVVGRNGKSIWVAGSTPRQWVEYPLNDNNVDADGLPLQTLTGHLGDIICATTSAMHMVTAGADALALVWERSRRRPLSKNAAASAAVDDKDTW
jgi:WD40 repeat protein